MPNFILSYRPARDFDALADSGTLPAWGSFINDTLAAHLVDPGFPVFEPAATIGETGDSTRLGGYSIVTADDLEAAVRMAKSCPTVTRGGGVEVGLLAELPEEHPAEQIRSDLASA
jgi:hypothetical protein